MASTAANSGATGPFWAMIRSSDAFDIGGGEVGAVVELDARAQLEDPGRRVGRFPRGRQLRHRLPVAASRPTSVSRTCCITVWVMPSTDCAPCGSRVVSLACSPIFSSPAASARLGLASATGFAAGGCAAAAGDAAATGDAGAAAAARQARQAGSGRLRLARPAWSRRASGPRQAWPWRLAARARRRPARQRWRLPSASRAGTVVVGITVSSSSIESGHVGRSQRV